MAQRVKKYGTEAMQTEMLVIQTSFGPGMQAEKCVYLMHEFQRVKLLSEWCPKDPRNALQHFITTSAPETDLKTFLVGVKLLMSDVQALNKVPHAITKGLVSDFAKVRSKPMKADLRSFLDACFLEICAMKLSLGGKVEDAVKWDSGACRRKMQRS